MDSSDLLTYFRGRVALRETLAALGVGEGDDVAVQAFTCLAVPLPVRSLGANPVFVDTDPQDLGMSVGDLESKLTAATRAIVVQHTFGIPADLPRIRSLASERGIPLIEDACHGFGGRAGGIDTGTAGVAAFYSFEWGKPVVAGIGGGLRVNDPALRAELERRRVALERPSLAQRAKLELQYIAYRTLLSGRTYWALRSAYHRAEELGLVVGTFREEDFSGDSHEEYGLMMAPGSERRLRKRLRGLDSLLRHQREIAGLYEDRLRSEGLPTWSLPDDRDPVYLRYPIRAADKPALLDAARRARIELSDIFRTPVHPLPPAAAALAGYQAGSCPVAEALSDSIVSLPVTARVRPRDVDRSVAFLARNRSLVEGA